MFRTVCILLCLLSGLVATGQGGGKSRSIVIKQAESLSYDEEKGNARVLRGNVICEHEGALLHCDTALIYEKENRMVARGHILITKGDSIRVTGENLVYDGKSKMATLQNNVRCVEKDMVLTTNILIFDVARSIASYYNGGKLVNKQNTLESRNGHYYSGSKEAAFHYDVVLTNPDYKMNSDTLRYKLPTKTTYFLGPSIILSKNDYIYCENGWYDTNKEKAQFSKNAVLVTKEQKLRGDSLVYDRGLKIGKAYRNVTLADTSQKSIIFGNYIEYHETFSEAWVTSKALYARVMEKDTLFIAGDTLYHRDIDSVNNFLTAYHNVKIFKPDLQAVCDSASMSTKDSLLQLFRSPILWQHNSQATAKIIQVKISEKKVRGFKLDGRAFLIQLADTVRKNKFDQLSGRTMEGFIREDSLRKIVVNGNAEIIYFPKNKDKYIGLNKTTCTEINMWLKNGEVDKVTLKPQTVGQVDKLAGADLENAKLKGFNWVPGRRPKDRWQLHTAAKEKTIPLQKGP